MFYQLHCSWMPKYSGSSLYRCIIIALIFIPLSLLCLACKLLVHSTRYCYYDNNSYFYTSVVLRHSINGQSYKHPLSYFITVDSFVTLQQTNDCTLLTRTHYTAIALVLFLAHAFLLCVFFMRMFTRTLSYHNSVECEICKCESCSSSISSVCICVVETPLFISGYFRQFCMITVHIAVFRSTQLPVGTAEVMHNFRFFSTFRAISRVTLYN